MLKPEKWYESDFAMNSDKKEWVGISPSSTYYLQIYIFQ